MSREILKKVFVNEEGDKIMSSLNLHKKTDAFRYTQEEPAIRWEIKHDLNTTGVLVQVWDESNEVIIPKRISIDNSFLVTVEFSQEQSGRAFLVVNKLP